MIATQASARVSSEPKIVILLYSSWIALGTWDFGPAGMLAPHPRRKQPKENRTRVSISQGAYMGLYAQAHLSCTVCVCVQCVVASPMLNMRKRERESRSMASSSVLKREVPEANPKKNPLGRRPLRYLPIGVRVEFRVAVLGHVPVLVLELLRVHAPLVLRGDLVHALRVALHGLPRRRALRTSRATARSAAHGKRVVLVIL